MSAAELAEFREFAMDRDRFWIYVVCFHDFDFWPCPCTATQAMTFRLERVEEGATVVLKLSGRLEKENLPDVQRVCEALRGDDRDLVLDLEEVKLVDQGVVQFLGRCAADGARLRNCPPYIRQWIEQVQEGDA